MKISLADEAMAIISSRQKERVKEEKGYVKIWQLDSNNGDFYSDSSVESDTDESSDSLGSIGSIIRAHLLCHAFFCLFSPPSHSSVCILFRLPHFARPASRNTDLQKNYSSALSALRNTSVFWRFVRKFQHEKKLSKR